MKRALAAVRQELGPDPTPTFPKPVNPTCGDCRGAGS